LVVEATSKVPLTRRHEQDTAVHLLKEPSNPKNSWQFAEFFPPTMMTQDLYLHFVL